MNSSDGRLVLYFEIEPIRGANGLRDAMVSETVHMIEHIVFSEQNGVKFIMLEARLLKLVQKYLFDQNTKVLKICEAKKEAKLGEMIVQNSMQLIDVIKSEMKTYPDGFELGILK